MTGGAALRQATVIVSAKGAARWQAGHPWIYRTDVYDEPGDAPGIVAVTDRRGRPLGQALYSPKSEIRLRLLTRGREPVDATWWQRSIARAAARRAGLAATAYRVVHAEGDGLPSLVVDRYGPYVVAQLPSAGLEQVRDDVLAGSGGARAGERDAQRTHQHRVARGERVRCAARARASRRALRHGGARPARVRQVQAESGSRPRRLQGDQPARHAPAGPGRRAVHLLLLLPREPLGLPRDGGRRSPGLRDPPAARRRHRRGARPPGDRQRAGDRVPEGRPAARRGLSSPLTKPLSFTTLHSWPCRRPRSSAECSSASWSPTWRSWG